MKKLLVSILIIVAIFAATGCSSQNKLEEAAFLTVSEYWWFYDETTGESEKMRFSADGTFYWGCECGEPIGDSDLYELYEYDADTGTILLYNNYDATSMKMEVLDYSDYHILLKIDGHVKDYTCGNGMAGEMDMISPEMYISGYNMYGWITETDGENAVVGPYDYDGDVEYPENAFKSYPLADNIRFFSLQITSVMDADTGDTSHEVEFDDMDYESGISALDMGYGFIWFNDNMEIRKVVYYGSTCIQE